MADVATPDLTAFWEAKTERYCQRMYGDCDIFKFSSVFIFYSCCSVRLDL